MRCSPSIFFLGFIISLAVRIPAQTEDQNLHKYWHYRQRLINDFVIVGPDSGQSTPAGVRNLWNGFGMHYGDAPVYAGYYISTLCTEYRLLRLHRQEANHTLTELSYALEALNRNAVEAEKSWGIYNGMNPRTGYMLEADVPAYFCQHNNPRLNRRVTDSAFTKGSGICGRVDNVISPHTVADKFNNTTSQDHIANLLVGLDFCAAYVGDSLSFHDVITGQERMYSFRAAALSLTARIMHYMRDKPFGGHSWILHRPDGSKLGNAKGGIAIFNSYGFAKAGEAITGKSYLNFSSRFFHLYWKSIYALKIVRVNQDNLLFGLELSAVGDSWKGHGTKSRTLKRILYCGDYNASALGLYYENHYGWDLYYGSVYCLLHPLQTRSSLLDSLHLARIRQILNNAPPEGPFFHGGKDTASFGWSGSSGRFYDKPPHQSLGKESFKGNYNGLDYMLFFNCYRLLREEDALLPGYVMTPEFTGTY
ncbi:MAG: hypothetical protein ACHQRM_06715 [Bacteroidia bacterium]